MKESANKVARYYIVASDKLISFVLVFPIFVFGKKRYIKSFKNFGVAYKNMLKENKRFKHFSYTITTEPPKQ